jgi:hypothetical protein
MENWHSCFVPECFFDTVLFKKLLQTNRRLKHSRGCFNVVNRFRNINGKKGDLFDSFGVGMVDKDKHDLDYLKSCKEIYISELLILWEEKGKHHYIIQLNPPIEKWVLIISSDLSKRITDFGYTSEPKKLKRQIKDDIDDEEDKNLNDLVLFLANSNHPVINNLRTILLYLKEKNYKADSEELKQKLN